MKHPTTALLISSVGSYMLAVSGGNVWVRWTDLTCRTRLPLTLKHRLQMSHLKGVSPVCVRMCIASADRPAKYLPQIRHCKSSRLCSTICTFGGLGGCGGGGRFSENRPSITGVLPWPNRDTTYQKKVRNTWITALIPNLTYKHGKKR